MADTYTLHVAGLTRDLPICKVNDHMDIAAFIMFSDVELTVACAEALLKKCPEFDVILTAEAKGIPLAYEMARQSGKQWIPARKGPKLYMREPVIIEDQSITTAGKQTLVIDKKDIETMNGKRILIVDDVISTGGSLHALETLADGTKTTMAVGVGKEAQGRGLKAGLLVRQIAAIAGGNGGGKPDFAMAGVRDTSKIDDALNAVPEIVAASMK